MFLPLKAPRIASAADALLENDLADADAGANGERDRAGVVHFEHLARPDHTRLDEISGDVDHETNAGKAAATLDPTAEIVREGESLFGDAEDSLAW